MSRMKWMVLSLPLALLLTGYAFWVKIFWFGSISWEVWLHGAVDNSVLLYFARWGSMGVGGAITLVLAFGALILLYTTVGAPYFILRARRRNISQ